MIGIVYRTSRGNWCLVDPRIDDTAGNAFNHLLNQTLTTGTEQFWIDVSNREGSRPAKPTVSSQQFRPYGY